MSSCLTKAQIDHLLAWWQSPEPFAAEMDELIKAMNLHSLSKHHWVKQLEQSKDGIDFFVKRDGQRDVYYLTKKRAFGFLLSSTSPTAQAAVQFLRTLVANQRPQTHPSKTAPVLVNEDPDFVPIWNAPSSQSHVDNNCNMQLELKRIDLEMAKVTAQIRASEIQLANVNLEKTKVELEKSTENIKIELEKTKENTKVELEKTKVELEKVGLERTKETAKVKLANIEVETLKTQLDFKLKLLKDKRVKGPAYLSAIAAEGVHIPTGPPKKKQRQGKQFCVFLFY
jgi:hypothetical protein